MANQIQTIIFDLGGVLIDWNPEYLYRKIFDNDEEKVRWFLDEICPYSWNEQQDAGYGWPRAIAERVALYPEYKEWIEAYYGRWDEMLGGSLAGTVDILRQLRAKPEYQLLSLTNWSAETFPIAQQRFEFLSWFDGIVVSGVEKMRKPFPEIYELLLQRYAVNPAQAIFIDDSPRNIAAAEALGLQGIRFTTPSELHAELVRRGVRL